MRCQEFVSEILRSHRLKGEGAGMVCAFITYSSYFSYVFICSFEETDLLIFTGW